MRAVLGQSIYCGCEEPIGYFARYHDHDHSHESADMSCAKKKNMASMIYLLHSRVHLQRESPSDQCRVQSGSTEC